MQKEFTKASPHTSDGPSESECIHSNSKNVTPGSYTKKWSWANTLSQAFRHRLYWRSRYASLSFSLIVHVKIPKAARRRSVMCHCTPASRMANNKKRKTRACRERLSERDTVCYDVTIDLRLFTSHLITSPRAATQTYVQCRWEAIWVCIASVAAAVYYVCHWLLMAPSIIPKESKKPKKRGAGNRIHHPIKLLILLQCDSSILSLSRSCVWVRDVCDALMRPQEFLLRAHRTCSHIFFAKVRNPLNESLKLRDRRAWVRHWALAQECANNGALLKASIMRAKSFYNLNWFLQYVIMAPILM